MKSKKLLEPAIFDRAAFGEVGTSQRLAFVQASINQSGRAGVQFNSMPQDAKVLVKHLCTIAEAQQVIRDEAPVIIKRKPFNPIPFVFTIGMVSRFVP